MPAIQAPIAVEAGSYEPRYWTVTNPTTGAPVDLTVTGFLVTGVVASRRDGTGSVLLTLTDAAVWSRRADGRIYFQPSSATTTAWARMQGYYQAELTHPSGQTVRFGEGPFSVSPELVTP